MLSTSKIEMKGIDIFCSSEAAASSSSSSSTIHLGGRAIDRHNPIISDGRRLITALPTAPSSSELPPINPKPYHHLQKLKDKNSSDHKKRKNSADKKKKSSSKSLADHTRTTPSNANDDAIYKDCYSGMPVADIKKKNCAQMEDFITPPGSSRYRLSDSAFFDGLSNCEPVLALVPADPKKTTTAANKQDYESSVPKHSLSSRSSEKPPSNQVVVLRVSLHCKGCESKLRKHLSRMKGVSSFNIDFAAKKVTIVGDVTPSSVLASVSKVKNAQFWPVAAAPSPTSASATVAGNNNLEIKK